ncbi:DUF397 domain-containing protein [Streptomyces sp. N2-109]|uniref:DUF397 domain-containing protein n=1 Tax=Streptomyces gossypii TaxID=2883101 RepID=A0ABT2K168_9ACTN|nr:DUF397 domain-containing protein [Streptomyces gossypii]MCT2593851.1 DUF397 domain-containing protein [Streptomyces gossypii]
MRGRPWRSAPRRRRPAARAARPAGAQRARTGADGGTEGGDRIEIATSLGTVRVRDSKDRTGAILALPPERWAAFVEFAAKG